MNRLQGLGLGRASRTAVHQRPPPWSLYEKATHKLGKVVVERDGSEGFAVGIVDVSARRLWKAINDFERQVDDGYLPLRFAKVVGRSDDGGGVQVVQYFKQMSMGRWWFNQVRPNDELAEASGGTLRESYWKDRMDEVDTLEVPQEVLDAGVRPLVSTTGAWLIAEIGDSCTMVEYFNIAEIGGLLGKLQWLVARNAIRSTLEGMTRLARDYEPSEIAPAVVDSGLSE